MKGKILLQQEVSSCNRKFLVTENFFLWQEISSCNRKFLPACSKLCLRVKGFLPRFLTPWPQKFHPATFPGADGWWVWVITRIKAKLSSAELANWNWAWQRLNHRSYFQSLHPTSIPGQPKQPPAIHQNIFPTPKYIYQPTLLAYLVNFKQFCNYLWGW